jgi:hypothetical protein
VSKKRPQKRTNKRVVATARAAKQRLENMEDFHCDMLNLSVPITEEGFDKIAFFKAIGVENENEYVDEDGDISLTLPFASRKNPSKQHAHLRIIIYKDKSGTATINYHQTGPSPPEKHPPYLEDCAMWLGGFFKHSKMPANVSVAYEFEKEFSPTIPLPFPLVVSSKELSGLKVTGLSLAFPQGSPVDTAIVQHEKDDVFLFIKRNSETRLKEFDLYKELEKLSSTVGSLVRERSKSYGGKQTK